MDGLESGGGISLQEVKNRAVKGVAALTGRTFILQIVAFIGFFFLTVFLDKAEMGLFFAISELVAILGYFSDVGLAAALIQKKENPDERDIRSTFTVQQALVLLLIAVVALLTPWLKNYYQINRDGLFLLWSLVAGFFFASLKTIPSVLLERKLRFDLLVIVEIAETIIFYGLAVLLAWRGLGVASYAWAVLIRGVVGLILIYILSPWKIGFSLNKNSLKGLLKFGVPYQSNTFLAVIKDRFMNVFLWRIVGAAGVGILGWAQKWAQTPLRFVMDSVMKVTFPAYSRMQENKKELSLAIEKTIYFVSLLVFPMLLAMAVLVRPLISVIPRYDKWNVAVAALWFFIINSAWGAITTPLTNVLTAIGKIKTVLSLMVMWTVLTWIIYPLMAIKYGYNGVAAAAAIVSCSSIVAILVTRRAVCFNILQSLKTPVIGTVFMGGVIFMLNRVLLANIAGIVGICVIGLISYFGMILVIEGNGFIADVNRLIHAFKNRA